MLEAQPINFANLLKQPEPLHLPPEGELHSTQSDIYTEFSDLHCLESEEELLAVVPINQTPEILKLMSYQRLGLSFRSNLAQAGIDGTIVEKQSDKIVVSIVNRGDNTLVFEPGKRLALGKLYALGNPLQGAELEAFVANIQTHVTIKIVEEFGIQTIEVALDTRYLPCSRKVLPVGNLPRGTIRNELHDVLSWIGQPIGTENNDQRALEFAGTAHIKFPPQYTLWICHGKRNNEIVPHGESRLIYGDNTNHPIISECHGLATSLVLAAFKHEKV